MKYLITVFLLIFAVSARAQITLEHTYTNSGGVGFGLVEIDSGVWKYIQSNNEDTITIYNLDHSLDRIIKMPQINHQSGDGVYPEILAKNLFSLDGSYGYLISVGGMLRVFKEDGTLLFSCEGCSLAQNLGSGYFQVSSIIATDSGTKMIISQGNPTNIQVFSLPGKLPTCSTTPLAAVNPSMAYTNSTLPTSAYPNPSSSSVRIVYELPSGVSFGDLILTTEDGREVTHYHVTSAFSDLLIEASDLPSGSYFYHLVTEKGESQTQRIVMTK